MALEDDTSLQVAADESRFNFASLIESPAHTARRLDLWWKWELQPKSSEDANDEDNASNMSSTPEEMLARKQYHTMPFLMRNISSCPFKPGRNISCRRRSRTIKRVPTKTADVISQCFGIGSPNRSKRKRDEEVSTGIMGSIRQRITGWFSPPEIRAESPVKSKRGQPPISSKDVSRSRPLPAFELYIQSPQVRQMVLSEIDPSLHHDEEFIMNRIEASWQEMTSDEVKTSNVNGDIVAGEAPSSDITSHAYWLEMEKRLKSNVRDEPAASKKRKSSHLKSTQPTHSTLANWNTRSNHPVYFHYVYINENNQLCTAVEKRLDRKCPFCTFNCKNDEELIGHCGIYHGVLAECYPWKKLAHGFSFEAVMDEEKDLHIVVKSLGCSSEIQTESPLDFTFVRCRQSSATNDFSINFLQRLHKNAAAMDPVVRRRRLLALETNDAPASVISSYLPTDQVPVRQYYHSRTNLPLEDWNSVDSDDEPDEEWLHKMSADMIGEFEDISDREKKFMQMWNRFIKSHIVIADREIPGKCQEFIRTHINELKSGEMRSNLLLHLMNLWDSGVVSSDRILACMNQFDEGAVET
ncbi:hypothetical protein ACHAWO_008339 [Cyclotella atomus]|uniref:Polycomb protein VEFS-Box domain-containing protein n=1 Tax=Cyclotella atomus TaxID=382360 RepID=A0ABD3NAU8_9STRA